MEKIESKIKSAETIINKSHFLAHTIQIFTRKQVIELIKASKIQAIKATLEYMKEKRYIKCNSTMCYGEDYESEINSPELKVI